MPNRLHPLHINRPGAAGLNLRDGDGIQSPEWCTEANNLTLSRKRRLTLRPGTRQLSDSGFPLTGNITSLFSHAAGNGTTYYYAHKENDSKVYMLDSGASTGNTDEWVIVNILRDGSSNSIFTRKLKFQTFNGKVICAAPWEGGAGIDGAFHVQATVGGTFTYLAAAPTQARDILSAFGRMWAVDKTRLHWSDLLDETTWGASNYIELTRVFPDGSDFPVGIQEYNGFLIIFGSRSIIVYDGADEVAAGNMVKVETIAGVGLLHRDLIQDVGDDLVFMSNAGLVSLSRVIQEKSMPLNRIGDHMTDAMLEDFSATDFDDASAGSAYDPKTGTLYMATASATGGQNTAMWMIDMKAPTPDGHVPITRVKYDSGDTVKFVPGSVGLANYKADTATGGGAMVSYLQGSTVKVGVLDPDLTTDGNDSSGANGVAIPRIEYSTGWLDFSEVEAGDVEKLIKELRLVTAGGNSLAWSLTLYGDYDESSALYTGSVTASASATSPKVLFDAAGEAGVVKIVLSAEDVSADVTITRASLYAKRGKLSQ